MNVAVHFFGTRSDSGLTVKQFQIIVVIIIGFGVKFQQHETLRFFVLDVKLYQSFSIVSNTFHKLSNTYERGCTCAIHACVGVLRTVVTEKGEREKNRSAENIYACRAHRPSSFDYQVIPVSDTNFPLYF